MIQEKIVVHGLLFTQIVVVRKMIAIKARDQKVYY